MAMKGTHDGWWSCDGGGNPDGNQRLAAPDQHSSGLTRRSVLLSAAMGLAGWMGSRTSALGQIAVVPGRLQSHSNILVVVFLRGGADGLSIVAPYGEDSYYRARPSLSISAPRGVESSDRLLNLDGFFGFHPALSPLLPLFKEGNLAAVHAVGSADQTRSHFEAMSAMENGLPKAGGSLSSGWLARYLGSAEPASPSPLRAVALGPVMPDSLRGASDAIALETLLDFRLVTNSGPEEAMRIRNWLREVYGTSDDEVSRAGRETLDVLDALHRLDPSQYQPSGNASYPESDLAQGLKQVAFLIKNDIGLEVACLDKGGWDTHVAQGSTAGWLTLLLKDLANSVSAFATDLGPELSRVTVVVQTEFGRRVRENSSLGTDHGRGSVMFLLGGGVRGGKVYSRWPGLEEDQLEPPGDLRVTTDYRNVLGEVLSTRLQAKDLDTVFPGASLKPFGIVGA